MISLITAMTGVDIVITLAMFCLLALSAWCDANGAEVYDETTVPYALLGIMLGLRHGRFVSSAVATALILFILQPWRPIWLRKLNAWLMRRAYRDTETQDIEREEEALNEKADSFALKRGRSITTVSTTIFFLAAATSVLSQAEGPKPAITMSHALIIAYSVLLLVHADRRNEGSPEQEPHEKLSAFGGADIIIFLGLLPYYGVIPFLFGVTASLLVFLGMAAIRIHVLKKSSVGLPLLPAMLFSAPIRFILALTVCRPIVDSYMWLTTLLT